MHQAFSSSAHGPFGAGGDLGRFHPIAQSTFVWKDAIGGRWPLVLRGAARHWPALRQWTFRHLAERGGARPVTLAHGNRELGATLLSTSTLSAYLARLQASSSGDGGATPTEAAGHLKEFDLFKELPGLAQDAPIEGLFPAGHVVSRSAWIGPRGAHTGLHHDRVDNLAVLVRGAKRFYLAHPGTVEALGALSGKYDRWARLAGIGIHELAGRVPASGTLFHADLDPGDAIYVPRGWWHEVVNLEASILVSGFFGRRSRLLPLWLATGARQLLHEITPRGTHGCTCHPGAARPHDATTGNGPHEEPSSPRPRTSRP